MGGVSVAYQRHPAHIEMMCTVKEAAVPKAATVGVLHLYHLGSRAAASDQKAARYPPSRLRRRRLCLIISLNLSIIDYSYHSLFIYYFNMDAIEEFLDAGTPISSSTVSSYSQI